MTHIWLAIDIPKGAPEGTATLFALAEAVKDVLTLFDAEEKGGGSINRTTRCAGKSVRYRMWVE
jgi:hypothetical protein